MLEIDSRSSQGAVILELRGRLIAGPAASELNQVIRKLVAAGERQVIVNLAGVPFMDSCAIGELVSAYTTLKKAGGQLHIAAPVSVVHDVLRLTRILTMIPTFEDNQSALSGFTAKAEATEEES